MHSPVAPALRLFRFEALVGALECALRDPAHDAPSLEVARFAMIAHAKRAAGLCFERNGDDPAQCLLSRLEL